MDKNQQILDLLEQLHSQTGIDFSIRETDVDEEATISVLKNMLHAGYNSTSKEGFWRSLLLGILSQEEILQGSHRFHIDKDSLFFPIFVAAKLPFSSTEQSIFSQLFLSGADSIIPIDDCHLVILRQLKQPLSEEDMLTMVKNLQNTVETEAMISINVSYDQPCSSLDALPGNFLNISTAMEIGSTFYPTQHIFWAHNLGMGKLIYHLPKEICEEYIKDHFRGIRVDDMDEETIHTIFVFLESGLNIAECARKLFLHRNTLIYRLDKIQKLTGLDIRKFDDAMTCKVAMMMSNYLLQND